MLRVLIVDDEPSVCQGMKCLIDWNSYGFWIAGTAENGKQALEETVYLKDESDAIVMEACPDNAYSVMIYSSPELVSGTYTLWSGDTQLANQGSVMGGPGMQGMNPGGMTPPEGMEMPEGMEPPQEGERPDKPGAENEAFMNPNSQGNYTQEKTYEFQINEGTNMFGGIS